MTAWHWAACEGNLDVLQELWNWTKEKLTKENYKYDMVFVANNEGWTAWHRATYVGKPDVLQRLWNWAEGKVTEEGHNLFLVTDNEGKSVGNMVAKIGTQEIS